MGLRILLSLLVLGLVVVTCQDISLEGRFLPLDGNQNPGIPAAVSWPASQITASFIGSSSVTAVLKDLTYTSSSDISLLPRGVSLLVNGLGIPVVTTSAGTISFEIGNLPPTAAVVTLTKEDESAVGE